MLRRSPRVHPGSVSRLPNWLRVAQNPLTSYDYSAITNSPPGVDRDGLGLSFRENRRTAGAARGVHGPEGAPSKFPSIPFDDGFDYKGLYGNDEQELDVIDRALELYSRDIQSEPFTKGTYQDLHRITISARGTLAAMMTEVATRRRIDKIHTNAEYYIVGAKQFDPPAMASLMDAVNIADLADQPIKTPMVRERMKMKWTTYQEYKDDPYYDLPRFLAYADEFTSPVIGNMNRPDPPRGRGNSLHAAPPGMTSSLTLAIYMYERDSPYDVMSPEVYYNFSLLERKTQLLMTCVITELVIRRRYDMLVPEGRTSSLILQARPFFCHQFVSEPLGGKSLRIPLVPRGSLATPAFGQSERIAGMNGLRDALEQATPLYIPATSKSNWRELIDLIDLAQVYTAPVVQHGAVVDMRVSDGSWFPELWNAWEPKPLFG